MWSWFTLLGGVGGTYLATLAQLTRHAHWPLALPGAVDAHIVVLFTTPSFVFLLLGAIAGRSAIGRHDTVLGRRAHRKLGRKCDERGAGRRMLLDRAFEEFPRTEATGASLGRASANPHS